MLTRKHLWSSVVILVLWILVPAAAPAADYPNADLLIETDRLESVLADRSIRIVDLRDSAAYEAGHIPGAVSLNAAALEDIEANRKGFPMPVERAASLFGSLGINRKSRVVAYDDSGGPAAARLFYVLEFAGNQNVRVLNGGFRKWAAEGRSVTTEVTRFEAVEFEPVLNGSRVSNAEEVKASIGNTGVVIIDARTPGEYAGADVRAQRGGHIPGAVNINWVDTVDRQRGVLKSADELGALLTGAGVTDGKKVIVYCQSGFRAAQLYFVSRLMGFEDVSIYDASWMDWGNRADLPVD